MPPVKNQGEVVNLILPTYHWRQFVLPGQLGQVPTVFLEEKVVAAVKLVHQTIVVVFPALAISRVLAIGKPKLVEFILDNVGVCLGVETPVRENEELEEEPKGIAVLKVNDAAPLAHDDPRGSNGLELKLGNICCSAHGLSLMVTAIKDGHRRTLLFDAGPTEEIWEQNVNRLKADIDTIEVIQLSHWHRDHSAGIPKALRMIQTAKAGKEIDPVVGHREVMTTCP